MLSTQTHNYSALGLTMVSVAGPQLFSGATSSSSSSSIAAAATTTPAALDPKKKPPCKRKRTGDAASDSADSSSQTTRTRDGPKKKKANRACFHCQKAHLTCDDSRPCQRCIKRGMADNCTEGHRKKAKYLLDEEELEALKRSKSGEPAVKPTETPTQQQPMFTYNSTQSYGFPPSEAANLEYSILSTILGSSSESAASTPNTQAVPQSQTPSSYSAQQSPTTIGNGSWPTSSSSFSGQSQLAIQPSETTITLSSTSSTSNGYSSRYPASSSTYTSNETASPRTQYAEYSSQSQPGQSSSLANYAGQSTPAALPPAAVATVSSQAAIDPAPSTSGSLIDRAASAGTASWNGAAASEMGLLEASSVYKSVTRPYDYTEGYHFLMKHLVSRNFDKNDILRIVRALAIYRPSLIALQMPMSEEDEVFIEKCFQRSLVELEKLVSFSGTPTLAWRRTGEICLVGPEFCMLTGWEREELIGKKKFYELFENQSVVEYWENFANHAFENTTQSVYSHCVLLKPSGAPVPCTFCFSIRRDIMDLPSLVIGQWLPLL